MTTFGMALRVYAGRAADRVSGVELVIAVLAVATMGTVERGVSSANAANATLLGSTFGIVIPLITYALVRRITGRRRFFASLDELTSRGVDRRVCSVSALAVAAGGAVVLAGFLAIVSVIAARTFSDPLLWQDALTTTWIAALAGGVYAAWFALGATFGGRGGGAFVLLAVDWLLGSGIDFGSAVVPRGHVRNLLGADPVLGISQPASALLLVALGVACAALASWRTPP